MPTNDHIEDLLKKYLSDRYTSAEYEELLEYFGIDGNEADAEQLLYNAIASETTWIDVSDDRMEKVMENAKRTLLQRINKRPISLIRKILPYAAALFCIFSLVAYWYNSQKTHQTEQLTSIYGGDALPGTNRATITLSDGSQYELSEDQQGITIDESGIAYTDGDRIAATAKVTTATIKVPRAGIYNITLPDGSKVYLNSESELLYPTSFVGAERRVKIAGEGYFEVAHDPTRPFVVESGSQVLKVLGTKFNLHAHPDAPVATTLLEGRVALTASDLSIDLKPGQQATLYDNKYKTTQVDVEDYTAWTRDLFVFNSVPLRDIFKQIERWYDVEIEYPPALGNQKFFMEIPKDHKLSEVLGSLSNLIGIKSSIEGRRVIVR